MIFIGDVHGEFKRYKRLLKKLGASPSIQLGDMGLGFGLDDQYKVPEHHKFIRGNHDNPEVCAKQKTYLGDFGYLEEEGIFFVSGAWSPDFNERIEGVTWWQDEELSKRQADAVIDLYEKVKPKIVATHDCPEAVLPVMYRDRVRTFHTYTGQLFDALMSIYPPDVWVFAHHHKTHQFVVGSTKFYGLRILEALKIEEVNLREGIDS